MIRAHEVFRAGAPGEAATDEVVLDFDGRFRRRCVMVTERGLQFLLDLERATHLRAGDIIRLDDGRGVGVVAGTEPLARIRCENSEQLARLAWHLGNRHVPVMIHAGRINIRRDHVIEEMVRRLGGMIVHFEAPFDPEAGAYDTQSHQHDDQ